MGSRSSHGKGQFLEERACPSLSDDTAVRNGWTDRDVVSVVDSDAPEEALRGVHTGATWRIPVNRSCAAAMRTFCQITLTTCYYSIQYEVKNHEFIYLIYFRELLNVFQKLCHFTLPKVSTFYLKSIYILPTSSKTLRCA